MNYVKVIDGAVSKYPYDVTQLRYDNPGTSFPRIVSDEMLKEWNVFPVTEEDEPSYVPRLQNCVKNSEPTLDGSDWKISWTISDKTGNEQAEYQISLESEVRTDRNKRLDETDWWAVSDRTMTNEQTEYRDLLRKVPEQTGFPFDITWPTKPS
tara:strand:+ start:524 stop:982 length:459 start_codon:yes stop_codon:yes gene_type:complete